MGAEIWETNRRIRSHILSHTRSVSHLTVQLVLVNAVRSGLLADVAGSAREHQTVVDTVFFWIKQVGAVKNLLVDYRRVEGAQKSNVPFATETEMDLVGLAITTGGRRRTGRHVVRALEGDFMCELRELTW